MDQLRAIDPLGQGWMALVLLLAVGMLAWVNLVSHRQWVVLARSFGALRLGRHRMREELDVRDRTLTGLALMSTVVIALFAYQALLMQGWATPQFVGFLWALLVVSGVLFAQVVVLEAVRLLPSREGGVKEYLYTVIVFHVVLGLMLLPVVALMAFPPEVAWRGPVRTAGFIIVAGTIMFRWVRAVAIGLGHDAPLRYIFLYLCTLEILPAALALELVRDFVHPMAHP